MRALISNEEAKKYYKKSFLLYPLWTGIVFTFLILIIYLVTLSIFYETVHLNGYYLLMGFGFGLLEAFTTILITLNLVSKRYTYYSNKNKNMKNNTFIPVIHHKGFMNNSSGVLIITKNSVEYKLFNYFEKKTILDIPMEEIIHYEVIHKDNSILLQLLTLLKKQNILIIQTKDQEYQFKIPYLNDIHIELK